MAHFSREYLSSNSLTAFPFVDDGVPERVYRMFSDAVAVVPLGFGMDASVSSISVRGDPGGFRVLLFKLSCGGRSYAARVRANTGSAGYEVVRVENGSAVVVDLQHVADSELFDDEGPYMLSASCADYGPGEVLSFSLWNSPDGKADPVCTDSGIRGDVTFVNGTNMKVTASEAGIRMDASPGAGEGKVPCICPGSASSDGSSKLIPDIFGGIVIEGDGCIDVSTPFDSNWNTIGSIVIGGRCTPPCPTSKYVEILDSTSVRNDEISEAYDVLTSTAGEYNDLVTKFNENLRSAGDSEFALSITCIRPSRVPKSGNTSQDDNPSQPQIYGRFDLFYANFVFENRSRSAANLVFHMPTVSGNFEPNGWSISKNGENRNVQILHSSTYSTRSSPGSSISGSAAFVGRQFVSPDDLNFSEATVNMQVDITIPEVGTTPERTITNYASAILS